MFLEFLRPIGQLFAIASEAFNSDDSVNATLSSCLLSKMGFVASCL